MVSRADYLTSRKAGLVIREELTRLFTWEERHRRLAARLLIALGLTLLVLAVGSVLIWVFESVFEPYAAVAAGPQRSEVSGAGFG
jgi:hypothetical protein